VLVLSRDESRSLEAPDSDTEAAAA